MSAAAATVFKPISMANGSVTSLSTLLSPKTPYRFLSSPSKPVKILYVSCSSSSSPPFSSWVSLKSKLSSSSGPLIALVARTSDWARQGEENEVDKAGFDWEKQHGDETEARVSDWEGEGEEVEGEQTESGAEEGEESGEGGYVAEEPSEEAKLFVGNLSYDVESADLAELFNQAGIVETAEVIYNRETDQSRGFGFVTMSSIEEAEKAVEMFNRYDINGRLLTVNKAAPRGSRVERTPREFEPSCKIYVGNLPWQVDDTRLEQVFSEHGKVVQARVVCDRETGRSRGFGFVTMSTQTELDDAIAALDGQTLDGRAIRVNVAEDRPRRGSF